MDFLSQVISQNVLETGELPPDTAENLTIRPPLPSTERVLEILRPIRSNETVPEYPATDKSRISQNGSGDRQASGSPEGRRVLSGRHFHPGGAPARENRVQICSHHRCRSGNHPIQRNGRTLLESHVSLIFSL
ncbi:hypothetical protein AVEN_32806-1 [Araneus ventricosus]|uniref:Uncharacterized protein n=1 Tax=Araneus ventricosus TaxID=182803 RepID=A0A4Y2SRA7_ARAVE|nr:hypothetical protein AVEN_32806-1 [Araneus ventricosus]